MLCDLSPFSSSKFFHYYFYELQTEIQPNHFNLPIKDIFNSVSFGLQKEIPFIIWG